MEDYINNWWDQRTLLSKPLLLYRKEILKLVDEALTRCETL